jgi:hypothetical protein
MRGRVGLRLTADHGHPRASHCPPQIPHPSSGRMRLTLTYCACALCSEHAPYYYLLRMRCWMRLMLTADHGHLCTAHHQPQIPHRSSGRMRPTLTYCACTLCLEHGPCVMCYSLCCSPVCNVGGWVCLMLTADHGHPRAAHGQPQIPH